MDRAGKPCDFCKKGTYKELYFHDDMDGVQHCSKCGETVNRYDFDDNNKPWYAVPRRDTI